MALSDSDIDYLRRRAFEMGARQSGMLIMPDAHIWDHVVFELAPWKFGEHVSDLANPTSDDVVDIVNAYRRGYDGAGEV